ncbi:1-phosphatidylinositol 4,5-bisphosphate phosphodiesterase zeta-1 isoform X1 [Lepisosteus oculatus]|uniref:1-phosphatidylinositol 4,5-bisphosphate phosphodiesterase zeta-1 isoform X1 n=1 Tax=Lepisosteus oculatus TaxID=7918 RepID=UPI00371D3331
MRRGKAPSSRRAEIMHIYRCYAPGGKELTAKSLLEFLHKEQIEIAASERTAEQMIDKYEIHEKARQERTMTFEGFLRFMESKDCSIFNKEHTTVYQDMEQPLCHYFISSSHNTYLTGDQLLGRSHLFAYVSALRKGCRCLEIDCWDGPDLEPVVYHGYTLTSKILFRDVIVTIEHHAFEVSPYPVILSLENHCTPPQQEIMARYLRGILGNRLLDMTVNNNFSRELPSPNDLKYKILIKNKKIGLLQDNVLRTGTDRQGEVGECEESEDEESEEETPKRKKHFSKSEKTVEKKQKKKITVAMELSDLVIYTKSVKFISFSHSSGNQKFYENTSLGENKARKLARNSGCEFALHNSRFLTRIYPAGSRTMSSNYNPQEFWNVGSQLVALNFQSLGLPMDLNNGKFQDNGGCGYVLKPHFLRTNETGFDPNCLQQNFKPVYLLIKVISGYNLPVPKHSKGINPYVRVEIHGAPADNCRKQTDPVKRTSLNPRWDENMNFAIQVPDLVLVRFVVKDQNSILSDDFIGQYTLPFTSMKKDSSLHPIFILTAAPWLIPQDVRRVLSTKQESAMLNTV